MPTVAEEIYTQEKLTDLRVRYWGLGKPLKDEEKEVLLAALDEQNKALDGSLYQQALKRLREQGII